MLSENWDLSFDGLRRDAQSIAFFGLGFIQLKLSDRDRVHFYHPDLPVIAAEPHNHRYDFVSTIYRGRLDHCLWAEASGDTHVITQVSCSERAQDDVKDVAMTGLRRLSWYSLSTGSRYGMKRQEFHTIENTTKDPAVTLLTRSPTQVQFAQIIRPAGTERVCPFSSPIPEDELWRIVKECL